jgi:hypothetical protein
MESRQMRGISSTGIMVEAGSVKTVCFSGGREEEDTCPVTLS